ncbi:MAG: peptidylprolyl isomerase [Nanoarchaeota archaeon]|nr:peptidylprolyl isomerase [Nanoarchaeota archaeon]
MTQIEKNKVVSIHYTGTLEDGTVFDSSEGKEPLEFIFGVGQIIPGLEEGIDGLKVGEKKKIENISPDKAYGPKLEEAMQEVPKSQLPEDLDVQVGMQLAAQGPQGPIPVVIAEIKEESVVVDFNHPLAGKTLTFEVEVIALRDADQSELDHGHVHGEDGHHPEH